MWPEALNYTYDGKYLDKLKSLSFRLSKMEEQMCIPNAFVLNI